MSLAAATRARRAAVRCLAGDEPRRFAAEAIDRAAAGLPAAARPLFFEIASGVLRRRLTLDHVLSAWTPRGLDRLEPELRDILRVALHQLLFLDRVPPHAVVDDAVTMARPRARGLVNAVLRGILRAATRAEPGAPPAADLLVAEDRAWRFGRAVFPDPADDRGAWRAAQAGFDVAAVRRLDAALGEEEADVVLRHANLRPLPVALRPAGGCDADALIAALAADGVAAVAVPDHPAGVVLAEVAGDVAGLAPFRAGTCTVQGIFAARPAHLLAPRPGETVFDLCAAPGGKACQLAEIGGPAARVFAVAQDEDGVARIAAGAARLGLDNVAARLGDAALGALDPRLADAVLLDVPCSNTGVLNRRPEARHRLDAAHLRDLAALQRRLLEGALDALGSVAAPRRLVYSTCSVLPEENGELVRAALVGRPRWTIAGEIGALPAAGAEDGGYAALVVSGELGSPAGGGV